MARISWQERGSFGELHCRVVTLFPVTVTVSMNTLPGRAALSAVTGVTVGRDQSEQEVRLSECTSECV